MLSDILGGEEELDCYSGLYSTKARVFTPADLDELRRIFKCARETGRRVTIRSGGHSFDSQALGDDIVVSMSRFDSIDLLPDRGRDGFRYVRLGPGVTWGKVFAELQPLGLVPAVTVTTEHATPGGTLSGDCLSRFSPAYGKEGTWIEMFELLTPQGELMICEPPETSKDPHRARVFAAAIGGLGFVGAVTSITYRVLDVGQTDGRVGVRTIVRKYDTFENLAADLVPTANRTCLEDADPRDPEKLDAIWSALHTRRRGDQVAILFTSAFTPSPERRRMLLHRPNLLARILVEWLMRVPAISRLLWRVFLRVFKDRDEYVDDLDGFTFFMDGNARAKHAARRLGFKVRTIQQTFVVPSSPDGDWERARRDLVRWLDDTHELMRERKLYPTLHDVLFLPPDKRFPLSASADLAGFAVSYAFETSNRATLERAKETFTELSDELWKNYRGRVYLVKNVHVKPGTLAEMYGPNLDEFFELKRGLDPDGILRNEFLDRVFGPDLARLEPH